MPDFALLHPVSRFFDSSITTITDCVAATPDEKSRAQPVNYQYADGQHWDDSYFAIPAGAESAVATLYFQTSSREYMEFLRDQNTTNDAGQIAYDLWVSQGKSAPVDMDSAMIALDVQPQIPADLNDDGAVDVSDLLELLANWG